MRQIALALALMLGQAEFAVAQAPPPVPALPDAQRLTSYSLTASTCNCSVGFAIYGDATDVDQWIDVFVNGISYPSTDPVHGWTLTSATGSLGSIPRPITNAVLTFAMPQTATVNIVGARRPRRASQFPESRGVTARELNQVITDITATERELWDKSNRTIVGQPGEVWDPLSGPSTRAAKILGFDSNGLPTLLDPFGGTITITSQPYPGLYSAPVVAGDVTKAAANSAAIATVLATAGAAGGGTVLFPCGDIYVNAPIDNKYPFVMVQGCGGQQYVLGIGGTIGANQTYATRIMPTFACAVGSPALYHRTPYSATSSKNIGGGFRWIAVDGNSVCGLGLQVDTVSSSSYAVAVNNTIGAQAVLVISGLTGTNVTDAADVQNSDFTLYVNLLSAASQASHGVVLSGSRNANTSFSKFDVTANFCNGDGLRVVSGDNNRIAFRGFRCAGGTGNLVHMIAANCNGGSVPCGPTDHPVGGERNYFTNISGSAPTFADDVAVANSSMINYIEEIDTANLTPYPTGGPNTRWVFRSDANIRYGETMVAPTVLGAQPTGTQAEMIAAVQAAGLCQNRHIIAGPLVSFWICNGTVAAGGTPIVFSSNDGTLEWGFNFSNDNAGILQLRTFTPATSVGVVEIPPLQFRQANATIGLPTTPIGGATGVGYVCIADNGTIYQKVSGCP